MNYLLEAKEVQKSFGEDNILQGINLTVQPNEIVAFVGANGAGKSTTFKTILDITFKDHGSVSYFNGKLLNSSMTMKEDIGVVFDATNLPESLVVNEINLIFKKFFTRWNSTNFFSLIKEFKLPLKKKIGTFSKGMQMKLSVAVALSHRAKFLILDEVTSGLDPYSREELLVKLQNFVTINNGGILLSSHLMSDIEKIATRIVVIQDGVIKLDESKEQLLTKYVIVEIEPYQINGILPDDVIIKQVYSDRIKLVMAKTSSLPPQGKVSPMTIDELGVLITSGVT